ncbi:hypothetical protein KAT36_02590 [Candidatus Pacearchaeota archaeon]|nr:hypothetical protein [Candidatus Pacearchaeota archaeon]
MVDDYILGGKKLHNDGNIRIHKSVNGVDEHDVIIGENHIFLNRGIMSNWATASITEIRLCYFNLRGIDYETENPFVPIKEFGWALAKARIRELEDMLYNS